jgi:acyl-coenzyme A synthetase/AMP-(fatty) acid ligase
MLNALLHSDRSRPWVDRDGETQADLVAQAHRIAALLEGRGLVALSCRHARSYVPGLLGAWLAGATVELLPNVQPGTLDRVDADAEVAFVLHDDAARQHRSPKAIFVPDVAVGHGTAITRPRWPELAVRMTTSGTTERPKYVTKTMAQLTGELDVLANAIPPATCVLSTVPLSHLYGLLWGALLPLRFGARIVSHEALLPADIAAVVEREGVDLMISTPAHLRAMAAATMPRKLRVITSGARMPADLHMALAATHEWHVTDVLGSTETGGIATRHQPMNAWAALPGVKVSAPNGQLVVESPWCGGDRAELDDRIEMRHGGTFQYLGRSTELVKIAGKRAHAHAIEATVLAVPGVTDVALLVHAPVGKEPRVALAITVAPDKSVGREEIAVAIRQHFDAVFVPKIVKIVPRIPRSERGKVEAETLRELFGVNAAPTTSQIPVRRVAPGQYSAEIPHELVFFRGHFDAFAILPGAVLVERLVWPVVKADFPEINGLRAIKRLRFRRPVFPAQQVSVTLKRDQNRVLFEVSSSANVVASGQLVVD